MTTFFRLDLAIGQRDQLDSLFYGKGWFPKAPARGRTPCPEIRENAVRTRRGVRNSPKRPRGPSTRACSPISPGSGCDWRFSWSGRKPHRTSASALPGSGKCPIASADGGAIPRRYWPFPSCLVPFVVYSGPFSIFESRRPHRNGSVRGTLVPITGNGSARRRWQRDQSRSRLHRSAHFVRPNPALLLSRPA